MSQRENNPETSAKVKTKTRMLDELKSLSEMLEDEEFANPIRQDIPVLKSFVEDVPVLNETHPDFPSPTLDTIDRGAATFSTTPAKNFNEGDLDMSFLDNDPLEISDRFRNPANAAAPQAPQAIATKAEPERPVSARSTDIENPFLPRSTLEKLRESHNRSNHKASQSDSISDASTQLHQLLHDNPLNKLSFDLNQSSREYQALRQKASQLVNEVIRANMHRLEAELRMKLEQEVDRMFKELKKKSS
ncbi:MAG: hypothetical protein WBA20_00980 [Ketobacter sp.]